MSRTRDSFIVLALFLGVVGLLNQLGVWGLMGISAPHGLVIQGLLFFALYEVLSRTLFRPYLEVLDARDQCTQGKLRAVEALKAKALDMQQNYERSMTEAQLRAIREREAAAMSAELEEKRRVLKAKQEAQAYLELQEKQLKEEAMRVRQALSEDKSLWVNEILAKLDGAGASELPRAMAVGQ